MRKFTVALIVLCGMIIIPVWPANAGIIPIDLNDFAAIPYLDSPVDVAPDGSFADLYEDPFAPLVGLSNDPGFGDPEVIFAEIGGVSQILSFDFNFDEPLGNNDEFGAYVIDAATGLSAGSAFEFFTQTSGSGSVSFDLTSLIGETLGLQFQLNAIITGDPLTDDFGLDSMVTVSNVRLTSAAAPVPEPGTAILVGTGLFGLLGLRRKKFRN